MPKSGRFNDQNREPGLQRDSLAFDDLGGGIWRRLALAGRLGHGEPDGGVVGWSWIGRWKNFPATTSFDGSDKF